MAEYKAEIFVTFQESKIFNRIGKLNRDNAPAKELKKRLEILNSVYKILVINNIDPDKYFEANEETIRAINSKKKYGRWLSGSGFWGGCRRVRREAEVNKDLSSYI